MMLRRDPQTNIRPVSSDHTYVQNHTCDFCETDLSGIVSTDRCPTCGRPFGTEADIDRLRGGVGRILVRRRLACLVLLGVFPVIGLLALVGPVGWPLALALGMLGMLWAWGLRSSLDLVRRSKCPSCDRPFHGQSMRLLTGRHELHCVHCGLPLDPRVFGPPRL
ncbi:MAG: hypothetical protein JSV78_01340 [Phycisphaerales bacterium]|nr:MAG: hypothetical protein JSV78_01340 [Phycisphaerales bacterium]